MYSRVSGLADFGLGAEDVTMVVGQEGCQRRRMHRFTAVASLTMLWCVWLVLASMLRVQPGKLDLSGSGENMQEDSSDRLLRSAPSLSRPVSHRKSMRGLALEEFGGIERSGIVEEDYCDEIGHVT